MLSVDEGRGQGEERSPVQSQDLSVRKGLTQRQMGCFCPLIKWGQDNYYTSDNVCLTPLSLSPFRIACGPGSFFSKSSSGSVLSFQIFPHQLIYWHLATTHFLKKSLSLCAFLHLLLCLCPRHNSKSPCSKMPDFWLLDSRGDSHRFTKLCFEKQYLKWLVSVNKNLPAIWGFFSLLWTVFLLCVWLGVHKYLPWT